jgi:hypothetical protein
MNGTRCAAKVSQPTEKVSATGTNGIQTPFRGNTPQSRIWQGLRKDEQVETKPRDILNPVNSTVEILASSLYIRCGGERKAENETKKSAWPMTGRFSIRPELSSANYSFTTLPLLNTPFCSARMM